MNPSTESTASTETRAADAPLRRVDQLLAHYAQSHQNPTNELIHYTAIPCIMLSLVGPLFVLSRLFTRLGVRW
jgi:uncharacterized membrane protein YGL010W